MIDNSHSQLCGTLCLFQLTTWDECDIQGDLKIPVQWEVWEHPCMVIKHIYKLRQSLSAHNVMMNQGTISSSCECYSSNPVPWSLCPPQQLTCRYFCWSNIPANMSKYKISDHSWSLAWWYRYNLIERHAQCMHVFGWSTNTVDVVALFWHVLLFNYDSQFHRLPTISRTDGR